MDRIKLFVCCHRPCVVPEHPLLAPVQVGAALEQARFPGFFYDDAGENISHKNRSYCELTAQYWAWKNVDAAYYGFFHYRRFLYPAANAKRPYRVAGAPSKQLLERLGYSGFAGYIRQYDLIAPVGEDMHVSVREHYARAPYHCAEDLALAETIVRERCPEMAEAMERYLSGTVCYFGNIYIMKRQVFHDYCAWLFPVLEEFDRRSRKRDRSPQELRVNGYLSERLFGVYYFYCRDRLKTAELPRVHFLPDRKERIRRTIVNGILPPGSRRRSFVKQWKRR